MQAVTQHLQNRKIQISIRRQMLRRNKKRRNLKKQDLTAIILGHRASSWKYIIDFEFIPVISSQEIGEKMMREYE